MSDLLSRLDEILGPMFSRAKRDEIVALVEDKVEGLEADLFEAVRVAHNRGAVEWTKLNYPKWYASGRFANDATVTISEPIHPSDYKAAQEEISQRFSAAMKDVGWIAKPAAETDALSTLRALVHQIAISEYRDKLGHPLKNNVAYRDAVAFIHLIDPRTTSAPDQDA